MPNYDQKNHMKKLLLLAIFPIYALAQDIYIECNVYPANIKNIKEEEKVRSIYVIKNETEISPKDSPTSYKLTTTEEKYAWSIKLPPKDGQQLTIIENIDRYGGAYQSFIHGPKGFMLFSLGNCVRLDKKL